MQPAFRALSPFLTPLALLAAAAPARAQGGDGKAARIVSLRPLREASAAAPDADWGSFIYFHDSQRVNVNDYFNNKEGGGMSTAALLDLLRAAAGAESPAITGDGETLLVRGTTAQQDLVQSVVREITNIAAPVEVDATVYLLTYGTAVPRGGISLAQEEKAIEESLKNARPAWKGVLAAQPGRRATAGNIIKVSFVATYSGEVAKKAKLTDPRIGDAETGVSLQLEATPASDGETVLLTAVVSASALAGMQKFQTRSKDLGDLDIPQVTGARFASSAALPKGATLLLRADDAEAGTILVLLHPRPVSRKLKLTIPEPNAFFFSNLCSSRGGRSLPAAGENIQAPAVNLSNTWLESLQFENSKVRVLPGNLGSLAFVGDAAGVEAAVAQLRAAELEETAAAAIELKIVRAADWAAAAAATAPVVGTATLVAGARRMAAVQIGREETTVQSYQIAIAEEAAISLPRVRTVFRGLAARARVVDSVDGSPRVWIDLQYSDFGARERVVQSAPDVGDFERIARRETHLERMFEIPKSGVIVLGEIGAAASPSEKLYVVAGAGAGSR